MIAGKSDGLSDSSHGVRDVKGLLLGLPEQLPVADACFKSSLFDNNMPQSFGGRDDGT